MIDDIDLEEEFKKMLFSIPNSGDTSYIKNLIESMNRTPNLLKEDSV